MLSKLSIPSLLVTSVNPCGGKTVIGASIATVMQRSVHVAVCKICDIKCVRRREGLVSEDAEFLAAASSSPHPLDLICPQRFADRLPPVLCAARDGSSAVSF